MKIVYGHTQLTFNVGPIRSALYRFLKCWMPPPEIVILPVFEQSDEIVFEGHFLWEAKEGVTAKKIRIPESLLEPIFLEAGDCLKVQVRAVVEIEKKEAEQEQCAYCKQWYPYPVYLHHTKAECDRNYRSELNGGKTLSGKECSRGRVDSRSHVSFRHAPRVPRKDACRGCKHLFLKTDLNDWDEQTQTGLCWKGD
jgi:hypothetical protein